MKKIKDFIVSILTHQNRLGKDKLAHFYSASLGFALFTFLFGDIYASIMVGLISIYKELINDWRNEKGNPEVLDLVMSILPILLYWLTKL